MVIFTLLLVTGLQMCAKAVQFEITSPDGDSYQAIQNSENQFKYGYQVRNVNDQFQHVYKSPDNVTYGCYGYTHPTGGSIMHSIFFVADQFGYRTVRKGQPIIIYPAPGTSPVLKQWQELPIPAACLRSDADFSQNVAESSANNPVVVSFDGNQSSLESDSSVVNSIVVPYDHTEDKAHPVVSEINSRAQSDSSSGCWRPFPSGSASSFMQTVQCDSSEKPTNEIITLFIPFRIKCADIRAFEKELELLLSKFNYSS